MKRVLYLTNVMVPYRVRFFNELAHHCDLTVLYERKQSAARNAAWSSSEKLNYKAEYLHGIPMGSEQSFSLGILKHLFSKYDVVIVGCYNSPLQIMAITVMKMLRIPYFINLDGEAFIAGQHIKARIKRLLLRSAKGILVAGEKAAQSLHEYGITQTYPYYFSSLSNSEILANAQGSVPRNKTVLVVGQYQDYKGLDVAIQAAKMDASIHYRFVGTNTRSEQFIRDFNIDALPNVEVIPFLSKQDLEKEYRNCGLFVLPSRQECWGLVINEAASFGTPIVSTWGSGAAVEFLADEYPQYLAIPGNADSLLGCIKYALGTDNCSYCRSILTKNKKYSIESSVQAHIQACALGEEIDGKGTCNGRTADLQC